MSKSRSRLDLYLGRALRVTFIAGLIGSCWSLVAPVVAEAIAAQSSELFLVRLGSLAALGILFVIGCAAAVKAWEWLGRLEAWVPQMPHDHNADEERGGRHVGAGNLTLSEERVVNTATDFANRMDKLLDASLLLVIEDPTESECCAYEAGRYGYWLDATMSDRLAAHPVLVEAFKRGRADVPLDIEADERADVSSAF